MKRWMVVLALTVLMTAIHTIFAGAGEAASKPAPGETRQLLSDHQTVATFGGIAYRRCMGMTTACPDDCGDSGDFASFNIVAYLSYSKPGQYGDPMAQAYMFQVEDNHKKVKVPLEVAQAVKALKPGDTVLLSWRHDYVTRTEAGGGKSSFPVRPIVKLEKVSKDEADKLIAASVAGATSGPASRPHASSKPASLPATPAVSSMKNRDDQATVLATPTGTVIYITSPRGIGEATLQAAAWPAKIAVRPRYASDRAFGRLEGFACYVFPAAGGDGVLVEHKIVTDAQGLVVQIELPASLRSGRVQLSWVDAYR